MNADEIKVVLDKHSKWLRDEESGSRANFSDADLIRANFSDAYLIGADLSGANLSDADLSDANFSDANLIGANLSGANFSDAYLSGANLIGADLIGANLSRANLSGANLIGAKGILSFGPVGKEKRIGYAWLDKDDKAVIMLGCHVGNLKDTVEAIQYKYGKKSAYEAVVKACVRSLEEQKL